MHHILSETITFILAGGRGERLAPLTHDRSKPAVPFGDGRIIDFALANCLRSGIPHPLVVTHYQATHLTQYVRRWWLEHSASAGDATAAPVCVPAPELAYLGTADALFRNLYGLKRNTRYVLVLSADHIYEMNYRDLLRFHVDRHADATIASVVYPTSASRQFGILEVDPESRVFGFQEKPGVPKELPGHQGKVLANMGIYVFSTDALLDSLERDAADASSAHDIGRNILPDLVARYDTHAFRFEDSQTGRPRYWKDVGTLASYYEASMEWLRSLPSAHRLAGSRSVIAKGVRIDRSAEVTDSVVMPGVVVGSGARIHRAILDENVLVMPGARVGLSNEIEVVSANSIVTTERSAGRLASQVALTAQLS